MQLSTKIGLPLLLTPCLLMTPPVLCQQAPEDQSIVDAIEREFMLEPSVPFNDIDVAVNNGTAMLEGTTDNLLAKRYATRVASAVRGVRSVVNEISVDPNSTIMDWELADRVERALLENAATESFEVGVAVSNGAVTLTGNVESWQEADLCEKVAAGVSGIVAVDNEIDVDYAADRPDSEILQDVEGALRWSTLIDHELIDVSVQDGHVMLSGNVGSASERELARQQSYVNGVEKVVIEDLKVSKWARDPRMRSSKYTDYRAEEVEDAAENAMLFDPRVNSLEVDASYDGYTMTLRGTVDSLDELDAAGRCARNTVGVRNVDNRLKVRADAVPAQQAEETIERKIVADPFLELYEVDCEVLGSTAYLNGTVDDFFEKNRAEGEARSTRGIERVVNRIDVRYPVAVSYDPYIDGTYVWDRTWYDPTPHWTWRSDAEIRDEIVSELYWSPFVDRQDVTVTVDRGRATLSGTVDSYSELRAATDNAYEGGAVYVQNELMIGESGEK